MDSKTYLQWVMEHKGKEYALQQIAADKVAIESAYVEGYVTIYHLESDIVELQLSRKRDGENVFFLHFELVDEEHAKNLFEEMLDTLHKQKEKNIVKALLCCTSGMTTSFFAEKLNEASATLSAGIHFDAVPYAMLDETGEDYDIILAAPQIAYELKRIAASFAKKLVIAIPAKVFASYDAGTMVSIIVRKRKEMLASREEKAVAKVMRDIENNACVFVINMTHDMDETRYAYRLYNKGEIVETRQIIKQMNSTRDIMDILDTGFSLLRKEWRIDAV